MGEIVNLKRHRKRKLRIAKAERAAENRLAFGRTKQEKTQTEAERKKAAKDLEAHKREE